VLQFIQLLKGGAMTLGVGIAILGIWLGYGITMNAIAKNSFDVEDARNWYIFGGILAILATCLVAILSAILS
jgi:hypothetical protein